MNLLVPDKIMASEGEVTIRQYKCAKINSDTDKKSSNAVIALTNKRLILYAEEHSKKPRLIQHELYIDSIAGFNFYTGRTSEKSKGSTIAFSVLFVLFALIAGVIFWQAQILFDMLTPQIEFEKFRIAATAAPIVLFLLILIIKLLIPKHYALAFSVQSKNINDSNIRLNGSKHYSLDNLSVEPHRKEARRMFSELSSIVLDIQTRGSEEVLKTLSTQHDAETEDK